MRVNSHKKRLFPGKSFTHILGAAQGCRGLYGHCAEQGESGFEDTAARQSTCSPASDSFGASVTSNLVVSFYFAKRGFENVARIIKR